MASVSAQRLKVVLDTYVQPYIATMNPISLGLAGLTCVEDPDPDSWGNSPGRLGAPPVLIGNATMPGGPVFAVVEGLDNYEALVELKGDRRVQQGCLALSPSLRLMLRKRLGDDVAIPREIRDVRPAMCVTVAAIQDTAAGLCGDVEGVIKEMLWDTLHPIYVGYSFEAFFAMLKVQFVVTKVDPDFCYCEVVDNTTFKIADSIERTSEVRLSQVGYDDLVGIQDRAGQLRRMLEGQRPLRHLLLTGREGSGRGTLVQAAANEHGLKLMVVNAVDLLLMREADAMEFLNTAFQSRNTLVYVREVHILLPLAAKAQLTGVALHFLKLLQLNQPASRLMVIAAAPDARDVYPALRESGRLELGLCVEKYFGAKAREELWQYLLRGVRLAPGLTIQGLVERTEDWNAGEMHALCRVALAACKAAHLRKDFMGMTSYGDNIPVEILDLRALWWDHIQAGIDDIQETVFNRTEQGAPRAGAVRSMLVIDDVPVRRSACGDYWVIPPSTTRQEARLVACDSPSSSTTSGGSPPGSQGASPGGGAAVTPTRSAPSGLAAAGAPVQGIAAPQQAAQHAYEALELPLATALAVLEGPRPRLVDLAKAGRRLLDLLELSTANMAHSDGLRAAEVKNVEFRIERLEVRLHVIFHDMREAGTTSDGLDLIAAAAAGERALGGLYTLVVLKASVGAGPVAPAPFSTGELEAGLAAATAALSGGGSEAAALWSLAQAVQRALEQLKEADSREVAAAHTHLSLLDVLVRASWLRDDLRWYYHDMVQKASYLTGRAQCTNAFCLGSSTGRGGVFSASEGPNRYNHNGPDRVCKHCMPYYSHEEARAQHDLLREVLHPQQQQQQQQAAGSAQHTLSGGMRFGSGHPPASSKRRPAVSAAAAGGTQAGQPMQTEDSGVWQCPSGGGGTGICQPVVRAAAGVSASLAAALARTFQAISTFASAWLVPGAGSSCSGVAQPRCAYFVADSRCEEVQALASGEAEGDVKGPQADGNELGAQQAHQLTPSDAVATLSPPASLPLPLPPVAIDGGGARAISGG